MARRKSVTGSQAISEINISPLIDMVFILLIFFIVTTVFVEEPGVEVNRPDVTLEERLEKNSILLAITPDGRVMYGGEDIGVGGVRETVRRLMGTTGTPVIIQADEDANAAQLVRVMDEARLGRAEEIYLATQKD